LFPRRECDFALSSGKGKSKGEYLEKSVNPAGKIK